MRELGVLDERLASLMEDALTSAESGESTEMFASRVMASHGVSGFVNHTVPVVIHAWLRHSSNYRAAVESVIRCGGDTDTTAALTGALVGIRVGVDGIPRKWRERLIEWPQSVRWISRLGDALDASLRERKPMRPPTTWWPCQVARNVVFLLIVLAHGFRRLLPAS